MWSRGFTHATTMVWLQSRVVFEEHFERIGLFEVPTSDEMALKTTCIVRLHLAFQEDEIEDSEMHLPKKPFS